MVRYTDDKVYECDLVNDALLNHYRDNHRASRTRHQQTNLSNRQYKNRRS